MKRPALYAAAGFMLLAGCGGEKLTSAEAFDRLAASLRDVQAAVERRDCESVNERTVDVRDLLSGLEDTEASKKEISEAREITRPVLADADQLC